MAEAEEQEAVSRTAALAGAVRRLKTTALERPRTVVLPGWVQGADTAAWLARREEVIGPLWDALAGALGAGRYEAQRAVLAALRDRQEEVERKLEGLVARETYLRAAFKAGEQAGARYGYEVAVGVLETQELAGQGWQATGEESGELRFHVDGFSSSNGAATEETNGEIFCVAADWTWGRVLVEAEERANAVALSRRALLEEAELLIFRTSLLASVLWEYESFGHVPAWADLGLEEQEALAPLPPKGSRKTTDAQERQTLEKVQAARHRGATVTDAINQALQWLAETHGVEVDVSTVYRWRGKWEIFW